MEKEKPYYCGYVRDGELCKECVNNKTCKGANADTGCPVYKWRKNKDT